MTKTRGLTIILSAPSGTGKTTLCSLIKKQHPHVRFSVSDTTRAPRTGETDGVDYHFVSKEKFENQIKDKTYLEWAVVHNNYYGTSLNEVKSSHENNQDIILELDVQGAKTLRENHFDAVFILLLPPSLDELEKRLLKRGTEKQEKINLRLETAKNELQSYGIYDYVITNHHIDETFSAFNAILQAERHKTSRFLPENSGLSESLLKKHEPSI